MPIHKLSEVPIEEAMDLTARCFPESPLKAREDYFRWRYFGAPDGSSADDFLVFRHEGRLVSQLGVLRDQIRVGETLHEVAWLNDLGVDPDAKSDPAVLASVVALFKRAMADHPTCLVVGAGPHMRPLYRALRWTVFPGMHALVGVRRLSGLLSAAGKPAPRLLDPLTKLLFRPGSRTEIENSSGFAELDGLEGLFSIIQAGPSRTRERLVHKFDRHPIGGNIILAAKNEGALIGYLVARPKARLGARYLEVCDCLALPSAFESLKNAVMAEAVRTDSAFIRWYLSDPAQMALLKKPLWFDKSRPAIDDLYVHSKDVALLALLKETRLDLTGLISDRVDYGKDELL